jgi:hypothetical protein
MQFNVEGCLPMPKIPCFASERFLKTGWGELLRGSMWIRDAQVGRSIGGQLVLYSVDV